ncbi:MAG: protein kinase domain-containing protein [Bradymonadia bacterium]
MTAPETVSGYVLNERIAIGGMAEICLAYDTMGRIEHKGVVLKRLLPHLTSEPGTLTRFEYEIDLLKRLSHPAIPPLLDHGLDQGRPFLVLPYIAGSNLDQLNKNCVDSSIAPPAKLVVYIARQLTDVLHYLHRNPEPDTPELLHGDVTPANIILGLNGQVHLIDFGIAGPAGSTSGLTGTTGFLAPEIVNNEAADGRSDLYSLGKTLLRFWANLSTDQTAMFEPSDWEQALRIHHNQAPGLLECLLKCIALKPEDRFASARQMLDVLKRIPNAMTSETATEWLKTHFSDDYEKEAQRVTQVFSTTAPHGIDRTQALYADTADNHTAVPTQVGQQAVEVSLIKAKPIESASPPIVSFSSARSGSDETLIEDVSRELSGRFVNPIVKLPWSKLKVFRLPVILIVAASLLGAFISKSLFERALQKRLGRIMLDATPNTGLEIFVDGQVKLSNETPMFLTDIAPGPHTLIVQKNGYRPQERNIIVEPNGLTDVVMKMERTTPATGSVTFVFDIEKCILKYNKINREVFSGETLRLPANQELNLKLEAKGSKRARNISVQLKPDELFQLRFTLR